MSKLVTPSRLQLPVDDRRESPRGTKALLKPPRTEIVTSGYGRKKATCLVLKAEFAIVLQDVKLAIIYMRAISKESFSSKASEGSTFTVTLPKHP